MIAFCARSINYLKHFDSLSSCFRNRIPVDPPPDIRIVVSLDGVRQDEQTGNGKEESFENIHGMSVLRFSTGAF